MSKVYDLVGQPS